MTTNELIELLIDFPSDTRVCIRGKTGQLVDWVFFHRLDEDTVVIDYLNNKGKQPFQ